MNRSETKIRILAVLHILIRRGKATVKQIQKELDLRYDIQCDRKTIYDDIMAIEKFHPITYEGYEGGFAYSIKKGRKGE